jgi:hypothetical protein
MFITLCLVSFGIYLGQEYPNLPVVKNVVFSLFTYLNKFQKNNNEELNLNNSNEMDNSSKFVLRNMYNYLLSFVKSNTNTNLVVSTSTHDNDNLTESSNFSSNSYNLKRRTFQFLNVDGDEEEVFPPDIE